VSVSRIKRVPSRTRHATRELEVRTSIMDSTGSRGSVARNATVIECSWMTVAGLHEGAGVENSR
jgi:hypothetical protein